MLAAEVLRLRRAHEHVTARALNVMHGSGLSELNAEAAKRSVDLITLPLTVSVSGDSPAPGDRLRVVAGGSVAPGID